MPPACSRRGRATSGAVRSRWVREAARRFAGERQLDFRDNPAPSPYSEVHLNIYSPLSEAEILAIAEREGWTALACDRGGAFKLIEFWLENKFMLEIMNDHEWGRYKALDADDLPVPGFAPGRFLNQRQG